MALLSKAVSLLVSAVGLVLLLSSSIHTGPKSSTNRSHALRAMLVKSIMSQEHQFFPASHPNIRYVGRWTPTLNRLRWDASFSGAYIDVNIQNASSVFLSLHNAPSNGHDTEPHDAFESRGVSFKTPSPQTRQALPVSLLIRVEEDQNLFLAKLSHGLVAINVSGHCLKPKCRIRIIFDGDSDNHASSMQFEGIWMTRGGSLQHVTVPHEELDEISYPKSAMVLKGKPRRKTLEVVTDFSGYSRSVKEASVLHWGSQLGAIFHVDHVTIPAGSFVLAKTCTDDRQPNFTTHDLFFRSGPPENEFFNRPWPFYHYIPDAVVLDIGAADHNSFLDASSSQAAIKARSCDTQQTFQSFEVAFIAAYKSLIQQIRRTAYPLHPAALYGPAHGSDGYTYNSAPSTIPIFVLRSLDGSLEHATLQVVEQMQKEGDKSVFWIDTSGWLSDSDYNIDTSRRFSRSLAPQGHAKVTALMHAHLCHYLVDDPEECSFLKHDNYLGSVLVPQEAELDKIIEESKIKKLTEMFWGEGRSLIL